MKRNNARAFTLIELSVVLILSTLVVVFVLRGYYFVNRMQRNYQARQLQWTDADLFCTRLTVDFETALSVQTIGSIDGIQCTFIHESIDYIRLDSYHWVRKSFYRTDTFSIQTEVPTLGLRGTGGTLESLKLTVLLPETTLPLYLKRPATGAPLVRQQLQHAWQESI